MAARKLTKRKLNPSETPAEGRIRLMNERRALVKRTRLGRMFSSFSKKLGKISHQFIKNGHISNSPESTCIGLDEQLMIIANSFLFFENQPLARARIMSGVRNGMKELVIDAIQGHTQYTSKFASKMKQFSDQNSRPWNVALVQSLIDTAYRAGFDRVLFRDIETSFDYKNPYITRKGETVESTRERMKSLYTWTKKDCGFTKDEWIGDAHYWVREFP